MIDESQGQQMSLPIVFIVQCSVGLPFYLHLWKTAAGFYPDFRFLYFGILCIAPFAVFQVKRLQLSKHEG